MFTITLANIPIKIHNKYDYLEYLCRDYITPDQEAVFEVSSTEEEDRKELGNFPEEDLGYAESLCVYRKICLQLPKYDAFLMHAAVIAKDDQAYVFCAASGTGKSTHISLWHQVYGDSVRVINGDKPILRFMTEPDGSKRLYAFGSPWNGKEGWGENTSCPVKSFVFLDRGLENEIRRMSEEEILGKLFHQVLMPREVEIFDRFMEMLDYVISEYPFYQLRCNMDLQAAVVAYEGMNRG